MLRKVLIVDDNTINRTVLHKILGTRYEVLEAANGEQALRVLESEYSHISVILLDLLMPVMDGYEMLSRIQRNKELSQIPVIVATSSTDSDAEIKALSLGAQDFIIKPFNPAIVLQKLQNTITFRETAALVNYVERDDVTGLYNRRAFFTKAGDMLSASQPGQYVLSCVNIDSFKVINDQYGSEMGDRVLKHVGMSLQSSMDAVGGLCCRVAADNFAALYPRVVMDTEEQRSFRWEASIVDGLAQPITIRAGRYLVDDLSLSVSAMYDRAAIAEASVKGRYDVVNAQYDESMRDRILKEQEIVNDMRAALRGEQFEVWFQPQYNHSTGALIGAEALVRWRHPLKGLIPPGLFIPVFERNGFVYELDKYVWRSVCMYLRGWLDAGRSPLPVSVNASRHDILRDSFFDDLTGLLRKFRLPVELLRLEITESAFSTDTDRLIDRVRRLREYGFTIEIDDFGSGYSSLNTLKDVPADILKLDMRFLEGKDNMQRGGNILQSIVRMAKWLGMPVIAEGVETREQADFLESIGCNYVQGYLYARPMPAPEYEALARGVKKEEQMMTLQTVETLDSNAFWDPGSMDTLIFNSFVGGACIFEYHDHEVEVLRANRKYAQAMSGGGSMSVEDALSISWTEHLDEQNRALVKDALEKAIATREETTVEAVFHDLPGCVRDTYLRARFRVIGVAGDRYLVYCANDNITEAKRAEAKLRQNDDQLRFLNDTAHALLASPDAQDAVESVLGKMLAYFDGDRVFIYEYDYDAAMCKNTYEVCAQGVEGMLGAHSSFPLTTAQHWPDTFKSSNFYIMDDLERLRAEHPHEYQTCASVGANRVLAVSLRVGGTVIGALGVVNLRRNGLDYDNLAALGDYLAIMLLRRDLIAKIRSDNQALHELMNDTPGGFARIRVYPDGSVKGVFVNKGFCQQLGIPEEELLRHYAQDAMWNVHPDDREPLRSAVREMLVTLSMRGFKLRLRCQSGEYRWFTVFCRVARNESDEVYLNAYFTDPTEQEKRDVQRRELIENLPCGAGMFKLTHDTLVVMYLNQRYQAMIGRAMDENTDVTKLPFVMEADKARLRATLDKSAHNGSHIECDIHVLDGAGAYRPVRILGNTVLHGDGATVIYAIFLPLSEDDFIR